MGFVNSNWLRPLIFVIGCISLILGVIGIFLPLLPTTPFILLSAWCFYRSSQKAHAWMYNQAVIGPILKDWETKGAISKKAKITALSFISLSLLIIWLKEIVLPVQILVTLLLLGVSVFIYTRPQS